MRPRRFEPGWTRPSRIYDRPPDEEVETGAETETGGTPASEAAAIWAEVRDDLRDSLPPTSFRLWVEPVRPVSLRGATLLLSAPDHVRAWIERRYGSRVEAALRRHGGLGAVSFVSTEEVGTEAVAAAAVPGPGYTFERFVIGAGNRLAHAASLAVAERPGDAYNPLFLYGPPGLGKSHLMAAIAAYLASNHPSISVHYTTAERFTTEFVAALRDQGAERFKCRHRDLGALLIDDIQFLESKPRTEEEFFHTFNALHESGSQIVLSSDRPPHALEQLAGRLRDRFEWGLCAELTPPDLPTRLLLLRRIAVDHALPVTDPDALAAIAAAITRNARQLEGALTRVAALASVTGRAADVDLVRDALGSSTPNAGANAPEEDPTVEQIQRAVCSTLHVSQRELLSPKRTPDLVRARHVAIHLTHRLTDLPLLEISRRFQRDHSTVLYAIRTVSRKLESGSDLHEVIERVHARLANAS